jgi:hypothetical protein
MPAHENFPGSSFFIEIEIIKMSQGADFPKGSIWRKWDLHLHTPKSIVQNYGGDTEEVWNEFIKKIASLPPEIKALGITDYLFVDGYEYLLSRRSEIPNIELLIPNIEFRLNTFSGTASNTKRHNFHVLFDPSVNVEDIREQLLDCLSSGYLISDKSKWQRTPKRRSLEELGQQMKQAAPENNSIQSKSDLQVGFENITYDRKDILDNLEKDCFKGKYLLGIGFSEWDQSRWDQSAAEKRDLINTAHFALTNLDDLTKIAENQADLSQNNINKLILHSSDAHSLEDVGKTNLWIKADPTFEGLRQLLFEPGRAILAQDDPTYPRSSFTIDTLKVDEILINEDLSLSAVDIPVNQGLVAVAGGKGAGKTALVDIIANCYGDRVNCNDTNSFVKRISDHNPNLKVGLSFRNGATFEKELMQKALIEDGQIAYIAQGELEKYIGEKSDLDKYVNDLIFKTPSVSNSLKRYEFSKTKTKVDQLEIQIGEKSKVIEALEYQTRTEVFDQMRIAGKQLQVDLQDITERTEALEKALSPEKIKVAKEKQEKISELKSQRDLLIEIKAKLAEIIIFVDEDLSRFNETVKATNELQQKLKIAEAFSNLAYADVAKVKERYGLIEQEIKKVIEEIEKQQKEVDQFEAGIQNHAKMLDKKREMTVSSQKNEAAVKSLEEMKMKLEAEVSSRKALFKELVTNMLDQRKKYEEVIAVFSSDKAEVLSDLDFVAQVIFDENYLLSKAEDVVDNRRVYVRPEGENWAFKTLALLYKQVAEGDESKIEDLVNETERLNTELKQKLKTSSAISVGDFYRFLYGNYLRVSPMVKYKGTNVKKLSLGQKATVLIKIYLAEGDVPIIIDSHDDHLDNAFIMDELIGSIREASKYRQVILVSNNGNVVINSDADQVILAERDDDGKISYISGSIENPVIRDKAIKILEGGSEAFKKRHQKYRIS